MLYRYGSLSYLPPTGFVGRGPKPQGNQMDSREKIARKLTEEGWYRTTDECVVDVTPRVYIARSRGHITVGVRGAAKPVTTQNQGILTAYYGSDLGAAVDTAAKYIGPTFDRATRPARAEENETMTTTYTAMAYGMPHTTCRSSNRARAIKNAERKARKIMRSMKVSGQLPEIVVKRS